MKCDAEIEWTKYVDERWTDADIRSWVCSNVAQTETEENCRLACRKLASGKQRLAPMHTRRSHKSPLHDGSAWKLHYAISWCSCWRCGGGCAANRRWIITRAIDCRSLASDRDIVASSAPCVHCWTLPRCVWTLNTSMGFYHCSRQAAPGVLSPSR